MEDSQIIALYWGREEAAIVESGKKYGGYCTYIACNILRQREEAEECVNDTWLHAWNAIPPERPNNLKVFLGKLVRNLSINRYQYHHAAKRGGAETLLPLEELADCVPQHSNVEQAVEEAELLRILNAFLAQLKSEQRVLFVQRYWYALPVRELARLHRAKEGQISGRLFRLRKQLKRALELEGYCEAAR